MTTTRRGRALVMASTELLITETCCSCGELFAMTASTRQERLDDKRLFYCPLGHSMSYTGPTKATQLERELETVAQRRTRFGTAARSAALAVMSA